MGACHKLEVVDVIKLMRNPGAEEPAGAAGRQRPRLNVLGVGPHQIREGAFVRQLHPALEQANLVESLDVWRQAGVHTEDLAFNDGSDAQVVKDVTAVLPRVGVSILSDRLVVETVSGRNLSRFVIATQNCDFVRVLQLQAHQVLEGLLGVVTAIDVVAHEDV